MAATALAGMVFAAGCRKTSDNTVNYTSALNTYYQDRPLCLWTDPVKFPVQVDQSDGSKTAGYDALVDAGLLTRTAAEKKVFIIATKQVNLYDLSDKGHQAWNVNDAQPGYVDFCYGRYKVQAIDNASPNSGQPGATATVNYHAAVVDTPSWAQQAEVLHAFPQIQTQTSAPLAATATLNDTSSGWAVTQAPPVKSPGVGSTTVTPADGKVVQ